MGKEQQSSPNLTVVLKGNHLLDKGIPLSANTHSLPGPNLYPRGAKQNRRNRGGGVPSERWKDIGPKNYWHTFSQASMTHTLVYFLHACSQRHFVG